MLSHIFSSFSSNSSTLTDWWAGKRRTMRRRNAGRVGQTCWRQTKNKPSHREFWSHKKWERENSVRYGLRHSTGVLTEREIRRKRKRKLAKIVRFCTEAVQQCLYVCASEWHSIRRANIWELRRKELKVCNTAIKITANAKAGEAKMRSPKRGPTQYYCCRLLLMLEFGIFIQIIRNKLNVQAETRVFRRFCSLNYLCNCGWVFLSLVISWKMFVSGYFSAKFSDDFAAVLP